MNAAVGSRKHFTVAINWEGKCIEQWLEQYGAYLLLDNKPDFLGAKSVLASLIDSVEGVSVDRRRRALPRCNINVHEAMAIEDMLAHVASTEGAKVQQWLSVVTRYYVDAYTEEDIASKFNMTMYAVKRDKMMGILRLATRFKIKSYLTD
ncbi:hypothetical protein [Acinetobacter chengduensis]|uniref:Phage antitermination protein Q n=1 Tax=Acinetobacter chengduensis TaxID=2420890 RepID=A0ABX9TRQ3_9GAMM|nr:hypothetical protein [Acinetobacter chengduensis]RLL17991.1 hypothetical protein D9K81_16200 [Acinetobacter chengduensis]